MRKVNEREQKSLRGDFARSDVRALTEPDNEEIPELVEFFERADQYVNGILERCDRARPVRTESR